MNVQVNHPLFSSLLLTITLPVSLYANAFQSGTTPTDVIVSDLNQDGLPDMVVCHVFDDSLAIIHQVSPDDFQIVQQEVVGVSPAFSYNAPRTITVHDFNQDGYSDLVVLCSGTYWFGAPPSYQVLINDGHGTFIAMDPTELAPLSMGEQFPVKMVSGEFTGDEFFDLAIAHNRGDRVELLAGDGVGGFVSHDSISVTAPENLAVEDINNDSQDDLIIVTATGVYALTSTLSATYNTPISVVLPVTGSVPRAAVLDDWDQDGYRDLIIADANNRIQLLYGFDAAGTYSSFEILTDSSLDTPQDLLNLAWDGDARADMAVANLDDNVLTIFTSDGQVETLAVPPSPRRIASADLNGNGRRDLAVISQGDLSNPSNDDVIVLYNDNELANSGTTNLDITENVESLLGERLDHPRSVTAASPTSVWILTSDGNTLQEVNPSANLGSNPSARLGAQFVFPFEAGGVVMTSTEGGLVLERDASRIHEFTLKDGLGDVIDFSTTTNATGFFGLAFDDKSDLYYVSVPAEKKILKIDETGAVAGQFATTYPLWDLCYDSNQKLIVGSAPNRAELFAYTEAGVLDTAASISLRNIPYFAQQGFNGLGWVKSLKRFFIATPDGLMLEVEDDGEIKDHTTLAPAADTIASAYDQDKGVLYFLGKDLFLTSMKRDGLNDPKLVSLWPIIENDSQFIPGGMTFDQTNGELLISDANRPVVARLHTNGSFRGITDYTADVPTLKYTGGIAINSTDGTLYFRYLDGLVDNAPIKGKGSVIPLPRSPYSHISLIGDTLAVPSSNPGEMLFYDMANPTAEPAAVSLSASLKDQAFVLTDEESLYLLLPQGQGTVESYDIDLTGTAVLDWSALE